MDELKQIISGTDILSKEDERALLVRVATGDREARDHLIRANVALVLSIAKKYRYAGVEFEDLFSEGIMGLIHAIEGYNLDYNVRLSSYATDIITQLIKRCLSKSSRTIKIPDYAIGLMARYNNSKHYLMTKQERVTVKEIIKHAKLTMDDYNIIKQIPTSTISFEELLGRQENNTLGDILDDNTPESDTICAGQEVKELLDELLDKSFEHLDERDRDIMKRRYGLKGIKPETLVDIGRSHGLSKERVRQIISEVLHILKHKLIELEKVNNTTIVASVFNE
jgi:RNA polymerase primary sigma factor